jgi:hypothetical protein
MRERRVDVTRWREAIRGTPRRSWGWRDEEGTTARTPARGMPSARGSSARPSATTPGAARSSRGRRGRPASRCGRRARGSLRLESGPGQEGHDRPAHGAAGVVLALTDPALEARPVPAFVEAVLRLVHPEVHDRVHRVPLDLGIRAAGRPDVQEELDDLLVPQRLVVLREGVPRRGVSDVVAHGEPALGPQGAEARRDRVGSPGDPLGPGPGLVSALEKVLRLSAGRSGDVVRGGFGRATR